MSSAACSYAQYKDCPDKRLAGNYSAVMPYIPCYFTIIQSLLQCAAVEKQAFLWSNIVDKIVIGSRPYSRQCLIFLKGNIMPLKIVLVHLDATNIGDVIIYDTSKYILGRALDDMPGLQYEIVPMSIGFQGAPQSSTSLVKKFYRLPARAIRDLMKKVSKISPRPESLQKSFIRIWHKTGTYKYYIQHEKSKLRGADCIIFGGGGLIKFHRQSFHFFIDDITAYADAHDIPVLLCSQGIEGYDRRSAECLLLKGALNRGCVQFISTRDDIRSLREDYVIDSRITTKLVCDPAFWLNEAYGLEDTSGAVQMPDTCSPRLIGLNVIRPDIFGEYMHEIDPNELAKLYRDIIKLLHDKGYNVRLFSNGVAEDTAFAEKLLSEYPNLESEYGVTIAAPKDPMQLIATLKGFERFLAARLHAAITGSVLGIPNASLVWNRKQLLFGRQTGTEDAFITEDSFNADHIVDVLLSAKSYHPDPEYKATCLTSLACELAKLFG